MYHFYGDANADGRSDICYFRRIKQSQRFAMICRDAFDGVRIVRARIPVKVNSRPFPVAQEAGQPDGFGFTVKGKVVVVSVAGKIIEKDSAATAPPNCNISSFRNNLDKFQCKSRDLQRQGYCPARKNT